MISVSIVNRFYPPDPAITGVSAQELAEFLVRELPGVRVRVFATYAHYAGGSLGQSASAPVERIRSFYDGARKLPRLLSSLIDGIRLAWAATQHADVVISLTDPPLLGLWIGLFRRWRHFRWIEWTMDLYPEAFAAAGLAGPRNFAYRLLLARVAARAADAYIALGPRQAEYLMTHRARRPFFVLPCGVCDVAQGPPPDWRGEFPRHVVLAYAGNLGEAHDVDLLIQFVRHAEPARFRVLLALYGAGAARARAALCSLPQVIWRERVSHADLAHADVHLVSLRPEWAQVCVPSKAVSSICLGRPIAYAGPVESDNWELLRAGAWRVVGGEQAIRRVLDEIGDTATLEGKRRGALAVRDGLQSLKAESMRRIAAWVAARPPEKAGRI